MSLPSYVINWEELELLLEGLIEDSKPVEIDRDIIGKQKANGYMLSIPAMVGSYKTVEWTLDSHIMITGVTYSQNAWKGEDYWELWLDDERLFETVYTKELGDQKHWELVQVAEEGQTIKLLTHNVSGNSKSVWADIEYIELDELPEPPSQPEPEIPADDCDRLVEVNFHLSPFGKPNGDNGIPIRAGVFVHEDSFVDGVVHDVFGYRFRLSIATTVDNAVQINISEVDSSKTKYHKNFVLDAYSIEVVKKGENEVSIIDVEGKNLVVEGDSTFHVATSLDLCSVGDATEIPPEEEEEELLVHFCGITIGRLPVPPNWEPSKENPAQRWTSEGMNYLETRLRDDELPNLEEQFRDNSELLGVGEYPFASGVLINSRNTTLDSIAIPKGLRLEYFSEPSLGGGLLLDVEGDAIIYNSYWEFADDYINGTFLKEGDDKKFPTQVRFKTDEGDDMSKWNGSFRISKTSNESNKDEPFELKISYDVPSLGLQGRLSEVSAWYRLPSGAHSSYYSRNLYLDKTIGKETITVKPESYVELSVLFHKEEVGFKEYEFDGFYKLDGTKLDTEVGNVIDSSAIYSYSELWTPDPSITEIVFKYKVKGDESIKPPSETEDNNDLLYFCDGSVDASSINTHFFSWSDFTCAVMNNQWGHNITGDFWHDRDQILRHLVHDPHDLYFHADRSYISHTDFHGFLFKAMKDSRDGSLKIDGNWNQFKTWGNKELKCLSDLQLGSLFYTVKSGNISTIFQSGKGFIEGVIPDVICKYLSRLPNKVVDWIDYNDVKEEDPEMVAQGALIGAYASDLSIDGEPSLFAAFSSYVNVEPQTLGFNSLLAFDPHDYFNVAGDFWGDLVPSSVVNWSDYALPEFTESGASSISALACTETIVHEIGHSTDFYYRPELGRVRTDEAEWYNIGGWTKNSQGEWNYLIKPLPSNQTGGMPKTHDGHEAPVSSYGCSQPMEDFAEAYCVYIINPNFLREKYPKRYAYMEKWVKNLI